MNCLIHTLQPLCGWILWMNKLRLRGLGWIAPPIPLPPSAGYETVCGLDKLARSTHPPSFILSPRYYFWREKKGNIIIYVYDKAKLFLHGWVGSFLRSHRNSLSSVWSCLETTPAMLKAASFRALVFTARVALSPNKHFYLLWAKWMLYFFLSSFFLFWVFKTTFLCLALPVLELAL